MKEKYPFSFLTILPTTQPSLATITVVAANIKLIRDTYSVKEDYLGEYSKELYIVVPIKYREGGCYVYGGRWVNLEKLHYDDIHFHQDKGAYIHSKHGYCLCVGTPESFSLMDNVILENVKTAENMLIAYERVMRGFADRLVLNAYSHGNAGRLQFKSSRAKYKSKR